MPPDKQQGLPKLLADYATPDRQEKLLALMQDVLEKTRAKVDAQGQASEHSDTKTI